MMAVQMKFPYAGTACGNRYIDGSAVLAMQMKFPYAGTACGNRYIPDGSAVLAMQGIIKSSPIENAPRIWYASQMRGTSRAEQFHAGSNPMVEGSIGTANMCDSSETANRRGRELSFGYTLTVSEIRSGNPQIGIGTPRKELTIGVEESGDPTSECVWGCISMDENAVAQPSADPYDWLRTVNQPTMDQTKSYDWFDAVCTGYGDAMKGPTNMGNAHEQTPTACSGQDMIPTSLGHACLPFAQYILIVAPGFKPSVHCTISPSPYRVMAIRIGLNFCYAGNSLATDGTDELSSDTMYVRACLCGGPADY